MHSHPRQWGASVFIEHLAEINTRAAIEGGSILDVNVFAFRLHETVVHQILSASPGRPSPSEVEYLPYVSQQCLNVCLFIGSITGTASPQCGIIEILVASELVLVRLGCCETITLLYT